MTPFRERNPVVIGAISLAVLAGLLLVSFKASSLPVIGGGDVYHAAFSEAGGLRANDEVRIAGVRVGKVEAVELDGDHVRVTFRVDQGAEFGQETLAAIKVKTRCRRPAVFSADARLWAISESARATREIRESFTVGYLGDGRPVRTPRRSRNGSPVTVIPVGPIVAARSSLLTLTPRALMTEIARSNRPAIST
jgi:hypothetical protein